MAKKKKSAKKKTVRKRIAPNEAILYLHVDKKIKTWLKATCKKQPGHVSQSTMVRRILTAARSNPKLLNAAI